MNNTPGQDDLFHADRDKRRVATVSLFAALLLTSLKITVGLWTNSLGILSEAAHSGLDTVAAAITLWAVHVSAFPADREHTYGHGKFENLSALFETILLLVTCVWIVFEAVERLFLRDKAPEVDPNVWAFAVVMVSIVVDISRSRALKHAADKYSSQALEADALHFSTDVWSSLVVLFGLVGVVLGERFNLPWLVQADSVAALGVAMIVVWVSLQLGKKTVDDLLDSVPKGLQENVEAAIRAVPGIAEVRKVRLRRSGPEFFADVTLAVVRSAAFEQTHDIANATEAAVQSLLPKADVVVHVEPAATDEDTTTKVRLLAARHGLGAHGIRIYEERGQRWLELHLEVSDSLVLEEAHRQASDFELALRQEIPGLQRIVTHIEPVGDAAATVKAQAAGELLVHKFLTHFQNEMKIHFHPHDVIVQQTGGELSVSLHCTLAPATPIVDAHDFTVRLEDYLRTHIPKLGRVVIHVEPKE